MRITLKEPLIRLAAKKAIVIVSPEFISVSLGNEEMDLKRFIAILSAVLLLLSACAAFAETAELPTIAVEFDAFNDFRTWEFPYEDSLFLLSSDQYHHDLARASFGMVVSAFRDKRVDSEHQGGNLKDYFSKAGFEQIRLYGYSQDTDANTISCGIASKKIEDFTLIAVGICGAGYGKEWAGNFDVGDEERHVGFNTASQTVQQRIREYIEEYVPNGKRKMWVSGFSRAAAVSNITAADMTDSGLFEEVFGYCFAAPRTTRSKGQYPNIYNILGTMDVVPQIPFADWGYERFGVDLFTPAQETNSDYFPKAVAASAVNKAFKNESFRNNPEVNEQLHTVLDYLLDLMPTSADYAAILQQPIRSVILSQDTEFSLQMLAEALDNINTQVVDVEAKIDALIDYLQVITYTYLAGNERQVNDGSWNETDSVTGNMMLEHKPYTYLVWLFSTDDPRVLYSDEGVSLRALISGNVDLSVSDAQGEVLTLKADGTFVSHADVNNDTTRPDLFAMRMGSQSIVNLPKDQDYTITVTPLKDETIVYVGSVYRTGRIKREIESISSVKGTPGKPITLKSLAGTDAKGLIGDHDYLVNPFAAISYTPAMMTRLESADVFHLTLGDISAVAVLLIFLIMLALLLTIVLGIRRIIVHKRRNYAATLVMNVLLLLVLFLLEDMFDTLLPTIPAMAMTLRWLSVFIVILLCVKGLTRNRSFLRAPVLAFGILCAFMDVLLYYMPYMNHWFFYLGYGLLILCLLFVPYWRKRWVHWSALGVLAVSKLIGAAALLFNMPDWVQRVCLVLHYIGMMLVATICWEMNDQQEPAAEPSTQEEKAEETGAQEA